MGHLVGESVITVLFRCGHTKRVDPDKAVICHCGERHVARTLQADPPRFTGHCTGPLATHQHLGPIAVSLKQTQES